MSFAIDKMVDFKLYKTAIITSLNSELKNSRKGQLIIHVGTVEDDLISLLQSRVFKHTHFNSFYTERRLWSYNRRLRMNYSRKNIYADITSKSGRSLRTRNNIDAYNNYNLIVDATKRYNLEIQSLNRKIFPYYVRSLRHAINNSNSKLYDDVLIVFNVDSVNSKGKDGNGFDASDSLNIVAVLERMIRRRRSLDLEIHPNQTVNIMIGSMKSNTFFKMPLDDDLIFDNRPKIISRMTSIMNNYVPYDSDIESEQEEDPRFKEKMSLATKKVTSDAVKARLTGLLNKRKGLVSPTLSSKIDTIVDKKVDDYDFTDSDESEKDLSDEIYNDVISDMDAIEDISDAFEEEVIGKTNQKRKKANIQLVDKQDKALKDFRNEFKFNLEKTEKKKIDRTVDSHIKARNEEVNVNIMANDFDKSYQEKQFAEDIVSTFKAFNDDTDIPLFIDKVDLKDTSDSQTYKDTVTVKLKDEHNQRHSVTVDIPKVYDGKYLKINGSKKIITKQLIMLPIVKTKPSEVWITTNYNKIIMERFGRKNNTKTNYLTRLMGRELQESLIDDSKLSINGGNSTSVNMEYPVSIDYMDLSSTINTIDIEYRNNFKYHLNFNQKSFNLLLENENIEYDEEIYYPVGFSYEGKERKLLVSENNKNSLHVLDLDNGEVTFVADELSQFIIDRINEVTNDGIDSILTQSVKANESLTYSRCKLINRRFPTIVLLAFEKGLTEILERSNIKYTVEDTNRRIKISDNLAKIKFKDKYLFYDNSVFSNTLLLSGLNTMDTSNYNFEDMDKKDPYLDYFETNFNSRNVSKGVHNAMTLMIDPITEEILEDLGQPTNIIDVLLYANNMLNDSTNIDRNDMNMYRIRSAEQINAILYGLMAESYKNYKDSYTNRNPIKVSLPKDALLKEITKATTVDESSDLNPSLELDKQTAVTYRGPNAVGDANSLTREIRGFDKSMDGILGITTPDSNTVGVVRQLSYDSKINGVRGYLDTSSELNSALETLSPLELLNPFTSNHADPARIGMQVNQQKHLISTKTNSPALISSGIEKAIPYQVSDVFATKAKKDGKVEKIDNKNGLLVVLYEDNTHDVFDISPKLNKNSTGGFYVEQKVDLLIKEGSTFEKGDILAKNSDFFHGNEQGNISYVMGKLSKVAVNASASTYEDSSLVTSSMSSSMASKITMRKAISIDKKANIQYVVKEGQNIASGQPLAIFEPEFDESSIGDILDRLGTEFEQEIEELSNKVVKSKYTGKIVKVNVFYNADLNDCSPSVKKLINGFINKYKRKEREIKKYMKDNNNRSITLELPTVEKISADKVRGEKFDGLLLEIYTEYYDDLSVGDKIRMYYLSVIHLDNSIGRFVK